LEACRAVAEGVVTRPRAVPARGDQGELWQALGTIGSRLAAGQAPGFAVTIRDEWLRLDGSTLPPGDRVERLSMFCVASGAGEARVRELVAHAGGRAARPGVADMRRRSAERRARLEIRPWTAGLALAQTKEPDYD
jgi:hypothetical protein